MLQTKKRGGQLSNHRQALSELRSSVVNMLRKGGTDEVVEFAKKAIEDIDGDVREAIMHEHKENQRGIDEAVARFPSLIADYEAEVAKLKEMRDSHGKEGTEHRDCRAREGTACEAHTECRDREADALSKKTVAQESFKSSVDTIKHCEGEPTESMEKQEEQHSTYVTTGESFFAAWAAYDEIHEECNDKESKLHEVTAECDSLKQSFEFSSCLSHLQWVNSYDTLTRSWDVAAADYETLQGTVEASEKDRKAEYSTLAEVKCLLAKVQENGGKPCEEEKAESEDKTLAAEIEAHCAETSKTTDDLNIEYHPVPKIPDQEQAMAYPCTEAFKEEEYGHLTGACFANLPACKPCEIMGTMED
jgi:predicted lactoylglutathione lyase